MQAFLTVSFTPVQPCGNLRLHNLRCHSDGISAWCVQPGLPTHNSMSCINITCQKIDIGMDMAMQISMFVLWFTWITACHFTIEKHTQLPIVASFLSEMIVCDLFDQKSSKIYCCNSTDLPHPPCTPALLCIPMSMWGKFNLEKFPCTTNLCWFMLFCRIPFRCQCHEITRHGKLGNLFETESHVGSSTVSTILHQLLVYEIQLKVLESKHSFLPIA